MKTTSTVTGRIRLPASVAIFLLLLGCKGSDGADFKLIQSQTAGDYTVSVLSPTGTMKNGASTYAVEFRKTSDHQLVDVGKVDVSPVMEMAGMPPMMGTAEVSPAGTPGRYIVKGSLTMAGLWKTNVKFGDQSVRFSLNAE
jgi:YtkA-like